MAQSGILRGVSSRISLRSIRATDAGCLTIEYWTTRVSRSAPAVIARSAATKQSSAREARQLKSSSGRKLSLYFACLPARGWIASP
jgi:hypothetical protein